MSPCEHLVIGLRFKGFFLLNRKLRELEKREADHSDRRLVQETINFRLKKDKEALMSGTALCRLHHLATLHKAAPTTRT
jgi:hypothetical protein